MIEGNVPVVTESERAGRARKSHEESEKEKNYNFGKVKISTLFKVKSMHLYTQMIT